MIMYIHIYVCNPCQLNACVQSNTGYTENIRNLMLTECCNKTNVGETGCLGTSMNPSKIYEVSNPHHSSPLNSPQHVRFEALLVSNMHRCFLRDETAWKLALVMKENRHHEVPIVAWPHFCCCPWTPRNSSILKGISHIPSRKVIVVCCKSWHAPSTQNLVIQQPRKALNLLW